MAEPKFENKPHYAVHEGELEIFDTRFPDGHIVVPDDQQAYEFSTEQLTLPGIPAKKSYELPYQIKHMDYVHGVTALRSAVRDGEDASGGIELLEIIVPGKGVIAAMQSYLGRHDNGVPVLGTSWACEFGDVPAAVEFWDKYWESSFYLDHLRLAIREFVGGQDSGGEYSAPISSYELGLLRPWFKQRTTDAIIGESFASDGVRPVRLRDRDVMAEEYTPGNVYKIPETKQYSTKIKGYRTATCLAALRQMTHWGMWMSDRPQEGTVIQWDDGRLTTFRADQAPELLPTPLTAKDVQIVSHKAT